MNRLILFIKKIYVPVLFIILEILAINYYASSTSYTKAKLLTASNRVVGGFHRSLSDVGDYFGLRTENNILLQRVAELETELSVLRSNLPGDDLHPHDTEAGKYYYTTASIINNSVNRQENYLTLDRGQRDGVRTDMALVTPDNAIAGIVLNCSQNFSVAISPLNIKFNTGGKCNAKDYFGSVTWNGLDSEYLILSEVPKYAEMERGDTIVTGYSNIFPPDIKIGTVEDFELTQAGYYQARVKISTPLSRVNKLLVVNYAHLEEQLLLEKEYDND